MMAKFGKDVFSRVSLKLHLFGKRKAFLSLKNPNPKIEEDNRPRKSAPSPFFYHEKWGRKKVLNFVSIPTFKTPFPAKLRNSFDLENSGQKSHFKKARERKDVGDYIPLMILAPPPTPWKTQKKTFLGKDSFNPPPKKKIMRLEKTTHPFWGAQPFLFAKKSFLCWISPPERPSDWVLRAHYSTMGHAHVRWYLLFFGLLLSLKWGLRREEKTFTCQKGEKKASPAPALQCHPG